MRGCVNVTGDADSRQFADQPRVRLRGRRDTTGHFGGVGRDQFERRDAVGDVRRVDGRDGCGVARLGRTDDGVPGGHVSRDSGSAVGLSSKLFAGVRVGVRVIVALPMKRCAWASTPLLTAYHDQEWGVPVHDDRRLFEFLVLEGAQAGLSWETVLKKRERYRQVFEAFDPPASRGTTAPRSPRCLPTRASSATGSRSLPPWTKPGRS